MVDFYISDVASLGQEDQEFGITETIITGLSWTLRTAIVELPELQILLGLGQCFLVHFQ